MAVGIIQARLGSNRLPGKVMMPVCGKPLLGHMLDQLQHSKKLNRLIVATPDEAIADYAKDRVDVYVGDERDVLGRYFEAAKAFNAEVVVRLTADNPLIDPVLVDEVIEQFEAGEWDYLSNTGDRCFPRGMDVEVFTMAALEKTHREAKAPDEREHVTLYMYQNPDRFRIGSYHYRLTVDTQDDFSFVKNIIERLQDNDKPVRLSNIWNLIEP